MSLSKLYQDTVLAHNRNPHAHHDLPDATHRAEGFNRSCGDRIEVALTIRDGQIIDAAFTGEPCAIAMAASSILMQQLPGRTLEQFNALALEFDAMLHSNAINASLGDLVHLHDVRLFPGRIKCARLPFAAVRAALTAQASVSTEA